MAGGETDPTQAARALRVAPQRKTIELAANQPIGRFGLIRELGRGGMGQVFLARDTMLGRKVAIKFLLEYDPAFVGRFLVEARATARCTHENIITIHEVGEHDGLPYMVLEYLEGKTLQAMLDPPLSPRRLVELMVSVVRALERAHEHGIVHRDLKPANIFITERGQVKVLDFGIAHEFQASLDEPGSVIGTLPYMSPEQWGADEIDARTDLWAVGMLFWRALAGVHPAGSMNGEKLRERCLDLATPLPSLAQHAPHLPKELVAIVDHCLAKRKAERCASATQLLRDLQAFLGAERAVQPDDDCPYRGLAAYGEGDARYFFGRSNEIRGAQSLLDRWPVLAVVGASGVGKSSFVHAGLVPAMRAADEPWHVRVLRPGRSPLARLAGTLTSVDGNAADVVESLRAAPGWFGELVRGDARRRGERMLIVVDQLEELFTLCSDDGERAAFLAALLSAADDASTPVRVVLSLRADFLDRLAVYRAPFAELSRGLFFLAPPDVTDLRDTLVRPAELAGYAFEPGVVDDMLRAAGDRAALPLLSFTASRLWDARDRAHKLLTRGAYDELGGVGGAFARHADRVAAAVPAQQQPLLRALLVRLVTREGTRAVVDHAELLSLGGEPREVEHIVDQLVQARLVHVERHPDHGATVEIVHEALITEWPALRRWLDDGQAVHSFVEELRQAARQWSSRGKLRELVWHGAPAHEAVAFAGRHALELASLEREYLAAVRAQIARSRRRRVTAFASIFVALGLVIAGGAIAVVRISAAEHAAEVQERAARDQAEAARLEALRAVAANKRAQDELAELRAEQDRRAKAESNAIAAQASAQMSREELERALVVEQTEKQRAQAAALAAQKAGAEATAANARTETLLTKERARVKQLEAEKQKIYSGGL
ncbi:MAG TPA: protein kinase [Kofleriaceae bacterium]